MKAVIFDMDGLLIDSEPFWKQAEHHVFSSVGVKVAAELAEHTAAMTTRQVTEFWYEQQPWQGPSLEEVEQQVIERVKSLIETQGKAIEGVHDLLAYLQQSKVKIGLASNSPKTIIPSVLKRLGIGEYFMVYSSADEVKQGKPAPDVYKLTLEKLNVDAHQCLAFEDSVGGIKAALAAGMHAIAVPHSSEFHHAKFDCASLKLQSLADFRRHPENPLLTLGSSRH